MKTAILLFLFTVPYGSEFQINTRTSLNQANAAVAMAPNGNFIVVWSSYFGTSGRSNEIFGRLFDPNCNPTGQEFQINTITTGNQKEPSVAMNSTGNFIAVWQGPGLIGEDTEDIFARRFDPNGQPLGDDFLVNSYTSDRQLCPQITMRDDGAFVIIWESMNVLEDSNRAVCGQLYDSNGFCIGAEFVVNEQSSDCRYPDVAIDPNGNFTVVWMQDSSTNFIMARLYNADCSAKTLPFDVSTVGFNTITRPSIAVDYSGHFVVTWDGDLNLGTQDDIHARLYDPNGGSLCEQFLVNTTIEGQQENPQVAMNNTGEFVIVWEGRIDPNISERNIFGQRYDSLGLPIGGEFQINSFMEGDQRYPAVTLSDNGVFITVWQSHDQEDPYWDIFGCADFITRPADFNGDALVDLLDYSILARQWHTSGSFILTTDLIRDGIIDGLDLASFCRQWLKNEHLNTSALYVCGNKDYFSN